MSLWLEHKYVLQAGMYLDQFKKTSDDTFKFRCPLCGDSQKSKTLCRGYIYEKDNHYEFKCHNCGVAYVDIGNFFSKISSELYASFRKERLITKYGHQKSKKASPASPKAVYSGPDSPFAGLAKVSSLAVDHPAKKYIVGRQIPSHVHWKLFYCPDFTNWANKQIPGKLDAKIKEDRILIPLYDEDGTYRGAQGRSVNPFVADKLRYITILLDKSTPVLYNAENVDFTKRYYAFEGPFDSMFVPNACATLTATSNYPFKNKNNLVRVLDNQPRNREVVAQYHKAIEAGEHIVIWPKSVEEKDLNGMIEKGIFAAFDAEKYISEHIYQGLDAKVRFSRWAKI